MSSKYKEIKSPYKVQRRIRKIYSEKLEEEIPGMSSKVPELFVLVFLVGTFESIY